MTMLSAFIRFILGCVGILLLDTDTIFFQYLGGIIYAVIMLSMGHDIMTGKFNDDQNRA